MGKKMLNYVLAIVFCISLVTGVTDSAYAKNNEIASAPIEKSAPLKIQNGDPDVVTWNMMGINEIHLVGPDDSSYYEFGLPADWKMVSGTALTLSFTVSINTGVQSLSTQSSSSQINNAANFAQNLTVGTLTIVLNDSVVETIPLNQTGDFQRDISIPVDLFNSTRNDRRMVIGFILDSGVSCYYFNQVDLVIRTSSYFTLPHESVLPTTNLVNFPQPIYQYTFIKDTALLVLPENPTSSELRAALVIASGLSKITDGNLEIDVTTLSKLTPEQKNINHLVFVGKLSSLPVLDQLKLPLAPSQGAFQVPSGNSNDGIVEMINSPWSNTHAVLIVSGNTDEGIVKAAKAVSSGVIRPNRYPNLSIVQDVQESPILPVQSEDQTLTELGFKGRLIENRGVRNISYYFNVPPGFMLSPEANFELVYGHSALIEYERSGVTILLNDKPIGSVRLSDTTAAVSTNKVEFSLPSSAIVPGKNRLDIRVTLIPTDVCTPSNAHGLWLNIWPESNFHLPLDRAAINPVLNLDLTSYPAPFVFYPGLENTAFVIQRNDLDSLRAALKISEYLGLIAGGTISEVNAYFGDDFPEEERPKFNVLIIGRSSQMPIVSEINKNLPVPFLDGKDVAAETGFQVIYRIPFDSPMGYIEMLPSPWNPDYIVLTVMGNTLQGLNWASTTLIDSEKRSKLAGNFAAINDDQVIIADTRLSPAVDMGDAQNPVVVIIPTNTPVAAPVEEFNWVFPLFLVTVVLIIILISFVLYRRWARNRSRAQSKHTGL